MKFISTKMEIAHVNPASIFQAGIVTIVYSCWDISSLK